MCRNVCLQRISVRRRAGQSFTCTVLAAKIRAKVTALGGCEQIVLNPLNWSMEQLELLANDVLPRGAQP